MKKIIIIGLSTLLFAYAGTGIKGKVLAANGDRVDVSPLIGERLLEDGTKEAILLRPQGVEKYYQKELAKGISVQTSINAYMQNEVAGHFELTGVKEKAQELFAAVMKSETGELIMLSRSSLDKTKTLKTKKIPTLKDRYADFLFSPWSMMTPIVLASVLDNIEIDKETFTLDSYMEQIKTLPFSSIISTLHAFGFEKRSGLDLPYDEAGTMTLVKDDNDMTFLEWIENEEGKKVTFVQLLNAYSVFFNQSLGSRYPAHFAKAFLENNVSTPIHYPKIEVIKKLTSIILEKFLKKNNPHPKAIYVDGIRIIGYEGASYDKQSGERYRAYFASVSDKVGHHYTVGVLLRFDKTQEEYGSAIHAVNHLVSEMLKEKLLVSSKPSNQALLSPLKQAQLTHAFEATSSGLTNLEEGYITLEPSVTTVQTKVKAIDDARVTFIGKHKKHGKVIILKHKDGFKSLYFELTSIDKNLKEGRGIKQGTVIGSIKEKLGFKLFKNDKGVIDPLTYMAL